MSLYSNGIIRIVSDDDKIILKPVGDSCVISFYGGINEGKDRNGNYIDNAIECEAWGKTAEGIGRFFKKGDSFLASGRTLQQKWEDRESGAPRSKHIFKIERFEFLPRANEAREDAAPSEVSDEVPF